MCTVGLVVRGLVAVAGWSPAAGGSETDNDATVSMPCGEPRGCRQKGSPGGRAYAAAGASGSEGWARVAIPGLASRSNHHLPHKGRS